MVARTQNPFQEDDGGGGWDYDTGTATTTAPSSGGALAVHLAAGTKIFSEIVARDASNTSRSIQEGLIRTVDGLKRFFGRLTATATPDHVTGIRNSNSASVVTTATVSAFPFGGTSPYTYAWTRQDGGGHSWTINNADKQTASFTTSVAPHSHEDATFRCTITDKLGVTTTVDVPATAYNGSQ